MDLCHDHIDTLRPPLTKQMSSGDILLKLHSFLTKPVSAVYCDSTYTIVHLAETIFHISCILYNFAQKSN